MPTIPRRALGALPFVLAAQARAQSWPSRPIRVVVPYGAGSATDILTRLLAPRMGQEVGQTLVIENKPGASGVVGAESIVKSPADGHVLAMSAVASHAIAPAMRRDLPYDAERDFTAIGRAATSTNFIVVHPSIPARTLPELVAWSKRQDNVLGFASGGTGSSNHLAGEMLRMETGAKIAHIPYGNVGQALNDVLAGHVPMFIYTVAVMPHVRAGRLHALACTSEKRAPQAPDVPTAVEQGFPNLVANSWFGLWSPAGLPDTLRDRLYAALATSLAVPETSAKLLEYGLEPAPLAPAAFRRFIAAEISRWREVVNGAGLREG